MVDLTNPFDLVKATDLSDGQIAEYFVDFPGGASLIDRIKPTSPMPMFIFGGKGSGKTHLMRYLSYPLQLGRGEASSPVLTVAKQGYLGIYFRCGGLNAQRFLGKGQRQEVWEDIFAYYMELWFGQLVLAALVDLYRNSTSVQSTRLVADVNRLLDAVPARAPETLRQFVDHLEFLQRKADIAINNCALTGRLDIQIEVTRGRLVFGLPKTLVGHLAELKTVRFLYLIDEFENLTEIQQRYINTLVREREEPCSFKVGVRLYGLRTKETVNTGEENREGSEYEALRLDAELRERPDSAQLKFARDLVHRRLLQAGYFPKSEATAIDISRWFDLGVSSTSDEDPALQHDRYMGDEAPYLANLRRKLAQGLKAKCAPGIKAESDIQRVIASIRLPDQALIERTGVFLLYRAWARGEDLVGAADAIALDARQYIDGAKKTQHQKVLSYFRSDIMAQLLRETKQKQRYLGFETFVKMSAGLPRGLLTILKHIFTWSLFYGEQPFQENRISVRAQVDGVSQASEWFFTEARASGHIGWLVRDAMTRLGQLLREVRFSDKPSECSLSAFSADLTTTSRQAIDVLNEAENWSMLIRIAGGQHDRNDGRVDEKYQVHPMLAPRWDLPIARRGALALSGEEITAIFAPSTEAEFDETLRRRVSAMMAPYFGQSVANSYALVLPGLVSG